jgi:phosphatidylethanolamine-binding protein (PEBP) family uncharacterized protein
VPNTLGQRNRHKPSNTATRRLRRYVVAALTLLGVLLLSGCGSSQSSQSASSSTSTSPQAGGSGPTDTASAARSRTATRPSAKKNTGTTEKHDASRPTTSKAGSVTPVRLQLSSLAHATPAPKRDRGQHSRLPVASIALSSPAIQSATGSPAMISSRYTCDGADRWPALHWSGVPAGTAELALFVISARPVNGALFFDWALAGIDPKLKGLQAGALPAGAVSGRGSNGHTDYSICPAGATSETYVFALYALPTSLSPTQGFDPTSLREQALHTARYSGLLVGTYRRA